MSKSVNRHITSIALFIIYMGAVAYICFGHPTAVIKVPRELWGIPFDKIVHFAIFFPYPFLAQEAFYFRDKWRSLVIAILTGLIFCFTFELLQEKITTYRTTDPWDLSINVAALTLGSFIVCIFNFFRK